MDGTADDDDHHLNAKTGTLIEIVSEDNYGTVGENSGLKTKTNKNLASDDFSLWDPENKR